MSETRDQDPPLPFTDPLASLRAALRGRYEIERQIGQGAFATVYLARDLKHERKVAIKVLTADPSSETGEIRFIREIRLVARLQHPNILPLHDSGHVETQLYYVMPYVTGETLRMRMHRERQLGVAPACSIAREIADALAYAHSQGIVHRDIKPENILLSGGHAIVADFGIARAIDVAGVKQLTMTGMGGPGTPAYMSPEQLLGDRPVDSRSDIYSLGCVLYEMLAGKPPFPGNDGFVKRFTEPPPHISSLRRDAPPWVDEVVGTALAKDPSDRYATAADLVAALTHTGPAVPTPARGRPLRHALASPPLFDADPFETEAFSAAFPPSVPGRGDRTPSSPSPSPSSPPSPSPSVMPEMPPRTLRTAIRNNPLRSGLIGLGVVATGLAIAAATRGGALPSVFGASMPIDSTKLIVLASAGTSPALARASSQVADSVYDALTRWDGLPIVPDSRVTESLSEGASPPTERAAISLARRLGAGRAVWIQATGSPQMPRLRIHLYNAVSAESIDEFGVPPSRGEQFYSSTAQRLVGFADRPPAAGDCDGQTRSFGAWSACNQGHIALAKWDLAAAERSFKTALDADGNYSHSRLWLGQVIAWRTPERRREALDLARTASESNTLGPRDRLVAAGLTTFFQRRFPQACAAYTELTQKDSLDFVGWYGLGECQSFDSAVVRRASSPSGFAFRSSWHSAVNAYMTALRLQPGAHEMIAVTRLQSLMPVAPTVTRTGISIEDDGVFFRAFPSLERGDTVGFIPYSSKDFALLPRRPEADAALRKNTTLLYEFTTGWTERFPLSSSAQEALADALEARAELGEGSPRASSVLLAADSAIALVSRGGRGQSVAGDIARLRSRKVRIHFKRGEFAAARILADSLLRAPAVPGTERDMQWIAALVGRADLAASHWQRTLRTHSLTGGTVPAVVASAASKYFAYAALGICDPQLSAARAQLEVALRDYIMADVRDAVRSDLSSRSGSLATPCTNGRSAIGTAPAINRLRLAQDAFGRGDTARARDLLSAAAAARRDRRPGDISADHFFQDAWLRTQVGDTATAERFLDAGLGALPTFGAATFKDLAGSASFGRAMTLRAELAAKRGDQRTARRWATAVNELWKSADAPLRKSSSDLLLTVAAGTR